MDQMLTGYSCKRSTNRWPLAMFYNMLDIAGLASFIIYDELNPAKQSDKRRSFIIELARQLVIPHMTKRATNPLVWRFAHIRQAMNLFNIKVPESCPSTSDATQQQSYAQVASKRSSCYIVLLLLRKSDVKLVITAANVIDPYVLMNIPCNYIVVNPISLHN
ncbi:uncharacterized protein LOC120780787 [Bactrocera tryoni]|uniref:uncharacterized protein LOC120780787 n=1 Tax=Bactrocera tryoni TaxID=59916 RepID=UPI001A9624FB|nr:uncharacterized protein LOC120780787 [Bactrocera tryoni]